MQDGSEEYQRSDGLALPQLFLVMRSPRKTLPGREWQYIEHQCGGIACHQKKFFGTPVVPRGKIALGLAHISEHLYASEIGAFGTGLDDVLQYREMLLDLGLDCQYSYTDLEEGYYPIDLPEDLSSILDEELPKDLDDLIDWDKEHGHLGKMLGIIGRWSLVWISQNSD